MSLESYEEAASAYEKVTGHLMPGKDGSPRDENGDSLPHVKHDFSIWCAAIEYMKRSRADSPEVAASREWDRHEKCDGATDGGHTRECLEWDDVPQSWRREVPRLVNMYRGWVHNLHKKLDEAAKAKVKTLTEQLDVAKKTECPCGCCVRMLLSEY